MNTVRRWFRLRRLRANRRLARAATAHSTSMVMGGFFSHTAPTGVVLVQRLRKARYLPAERWLVGENLASVKGRDGTPSAIVLAWLRSPPHRANLLDRSFREIGIGAVPGRPTGAGTRGVTFTANFGVRR
jgi:uncharacterized protein YkwD